MAAVSLSPLSFSPHSHHLSAGEPVYLGRRALQWELIFAKCGFYELSGEQGLHFLVALCLYCFWLATLFTIPLAHFFHAVELYMVFICSRNMCEITAGVGGSQREEPVTMLSRNALFAMFLLWPFFNSWIEKILQFQHSVLPVFWGIWDVGTFISI